MLYQAEDGCLKGGTGSENRCSVRQRLDCNLTKVVLKQPDRKKKIFFFTKNKILQQAMLQWHFKMLIVPEAWW